MLFVCTLLFYFFSVPALLIKKKIFVNKLAKNHFFLYKKVSPRARFRLASGGEVCVRFDCLLAGKQQRLPVGV